MKTIITAIFILSLACFCYADEELALVDIISFTDLDTDAEITSINNVGDFNADGYDDLLIGIYQGPTATDFREAAFLYYGGPIFDTEPDLIFKGEPNAEFCYPDVTAGFGRRACGLGDFNADGYDDIVISASGLCIDDLYQGRLYFYFGSPEPDTTIDLIIDGERYRDFLGRYLIAGDFNGDNIGDLYTCTDNSYYGPQVFIYLGSDSPNNTRDFIYDYSYQEVYLEGIGGGFDINGDSCDEFNWNIYLNDLYSVYLNLGSDELNLEPDYRFDNVLFIGDISCDGIDDFIMHNSENEYFLYLGGDPVDILPDFYMWTENYFQCNPFVCELATGDYRLITEDFMNTQISCYNIGVPFNTEPCANYNYHQSRCISYPLSIGDINADGLNEFSINYVTDSLQDMIYLYSMSTVSIGDYYSHIPMDKELISCYPNPFNSSTIISYSSSEGGDIGIYDITGRLVKSYLMGDLKEGNIIWDGTNYQGDKVSSGIYFVKLQSLQSSVSTKLIFMK